MKALLVIVGILAVFALGGVGLLTLGELPAVAAVIIVVGLVLLAFIAGKSVLRLITLGLAVAFIGALAYGGYSGYQLYQALSSTGGAVDPADPAQLASAKTKIDAADGTAGFRVEFTGPELTAVLQDALADNTDSPLRRVDLKMVDGSGGPGHIDFTGKFKNGGARANGSVVAKVDAGRITFTINDVSLGNFTVPGLAEGAVRDLIETVTDLNKKLAAHKADVQAVNIAGGKVVITGVQGSGELVSLGTVMDAVKENVKSLGTKTAPPVEQIGQGVVDSFQVDGQKYYVALGDSLSVNVGVPSTKDGYMSRFAKAIGARDGQQYGVRDFGVSGQTSSGLIRNGQLDDAVKFMKSHDVAYITIDIGANDLLGHLYSPDCSNSLQTPACKERLEQAIALYTANLETTLQRVKDAAPKAKIIFLGMYNPFSIGFGSAVGLEGETDTIVDRVNAVASKAAQARGMAFADGQSAIKGRAGAVTHMLDSKPDIHPKAIGYDLLASALLAAVK